MKSAIEELVGLSVAEGNGFDIEAHGKDPKLYEMTSPLSPAVRTAGEDNPALVYTQTMDQEMPQEGFIDEATDTMAMFPFPPEVVAAARAEAARGMAWQTGVAMIAAAIGGPELYRGLVRGGFDPVRAAVGLLFLMAAVLLFLRGRRKKSGARRE